MTNQLGDAPTERSKMQREHELLGAKLSADARAMWEREQDFRVQQVKALYGMVDEDTQEYRVTFRQRARFAWLRVRFALRRLRSWLINDPPQPTLLITDDTIPFDTEQ